MGRVNRNTDVGRLRFYHWLFSRRSGGEEAVQKVRADTCRSRLTNEIVVPPPEKRLVSG